jgi:hypothetical protein
MLVFKQGARIGFQDVSCSRRLFLPDIAGQFFRMQLIKIDEISQ